MPQHVTIQGWQLSVRQAMLAVALIAVGLASPMYLMAWLIVAVWWFLIAAAIYYPVVRRLAGLLAVGAMIVVLYLSLRR